MEWNENGMKERMKNAKMLEKDEHEATLNIQF